MIIVAACKRKEDQAGKFEYYFLKYALRFDSNKKYRYHISENPEYYQITETTEDLSINYQAGYIDFWVEEDDEKFLFALFHRTQFNGYIKIYDANSMISSSLKTREIKIDDFDFALKDKNIEKITISDGQLLVTYTGGNEEQNQARLFSAQFSDEKVSL